MAIYDDEKRTTLNDICKTIKIKTKIAAGYIAVIFEDSCGLYLCHKIPKITPSANQKPTMVNPLITLKEFTKSIGMEILSGFGGNKTNATEITTT